LKDRLFRDECFFFLNTPARSRSLDHSAESVVFPSSLAFGPRFFLGCEPGSFRRNFPNRLFPPRIVVRRMESEDEEEEEEDDDEDDEGEEDEEEEVEAAKGGGFFWPYLLLDIPTRIPGL